MGHDHDVGGEMVYAPALYRRCGLAAVNHPVRVLAVMLVVQRLGVIVSRRVQFRCALLRVFPPHVVGADGNVPVAPGIVPPHEVPQRFRDLEAPFVHVRVIYLVPYAPHDDAGMVPVPPYPACHVLFMPLGEEPGIVVIGLFPLPHVEGLGHDQYAHLVRQFHKFDCRHVVRRPDGIDAHFLQDGHLSPERSPVHGSAEGSQVMVLADPVELYMHIIEEKAPVAVETYRPEPEILDDRVLYFAVNYDLGFQPV